MARRGRPKKENPLGEYIELRVSEDEKQAFRDAADLAGIPLATWAKRAAQARGDPGVGER